MNVQHMIFEKIRKKFIQICVEADSPRLSSEVYPEEVKIISDLPYINDGNKDHCCDFYLPDKLHGDDIRSYNDKTLFVDVHGGGFVYGSKEINKLFGTNLALKTGCPVMNVNYSLVPNIKNGCLALQVREVFTAVCYACDIFGFNKIHIIGDSAGGFTALCAWGTLVDRDIRHDFNIFAIPPKIEIKGVTLAYSITRLRDMKPNNHIEDAYLPPQSSDRAPMYAYDFADLITKAKVKPPHIIGITGDRDSLREDVLYLNRFLRENGYPCTLFDEVSYAGEGLTMDSPEIKNAKKPSDLPADARIMYHEFITANPNWPECDKIFAKMKELT